MKPAPKRPDARARLLEHADAAARSLVLAAAYPKSRLLTRNDLKTRRLLRAHERELHMAVVRAVAACRPYRGSKVIGLIAVDIDDAIRAAILGPPRPAGRGKKGAKP